MPRPIARLLDALAGSKTTPREVARLWDARRAARGRRRGASRRGRARAARGRLAAPRGRGTGQARARGRRGNRARRAPHRHDAGREGRRRSARRPRRGGRRATRRCRRCRPRCAGWSAARAQAPALVEPAVKALDAALNALDEARGHLEAGAARRRPRSARAGAHRGAAVRAARRRPQIQCRRSTTSRRWPRSYAADLALIDAGAERLAALEKAAARGRGALSRRPPTALSAARTQGRREARQGGQRRAASRSSSSARTSRPQIESDAGGRRPERHRPRRVLGADQSRHAARPADEGRLRRRARALPAGAEGGAGRPRLGADAGVRRDRHRRRRRGRRRHRRAAGAARRRACR